MNYLRNLIFVLQFLNFLMNFSEGSKPKYNILILTSPIGTHTHSILLNSIAKELAHRGHQVTHRCIGQFEKTKGIRHRVFQPFEVENVNDVGTHLKSINVLINSTYQDPFLSGLVREPFNPVTKAPKYHVLVVDELFSDVYLPLAHHLQVPSVLVAISLAQMSGIMWHLNIPLPWSYYNPLGFPEPLGLFERTKSVLSNLETLFWLNLFRYPMTGVEIRRIMPNTPSNVDLIRNVSFILVNSHPPVQERLPTMPYKAEIGCPQCRPAQPLSKELNAVLTENEKGVIYFNMGHFVKDEEIKNEFKSKLVEGLSRLPQTVIWRDDEGLTPVPSNFRVFNWIPQQDLLGHPNLRLMITHGGMMSMHEAAYHRVPILGFPVHQDQFQAMQNVKRLGYGEFLDWEHFTLKELRENIHEILTNKKYVEAAHEASVLMKDRPHSALNVSAHWIEYVVRHEGAAFLRSEAENLYWFQYFMLDCIALIVAVLVLILAIIGYFLRFTFRTIDKLISALIIKLFNTNIKDKKNK